MSPIFVNESSVDLSKLAQAMLGDEVRFNDVSIEQAHEPLKQQEQLLSRLKAPKRTRGLSRWFRRGLKV